MGPELASASNRADHSARRSNTLDLPMAGMSIYMDSQEYQEPLMAYAATRKPGAPQEQAASELGIGRMESVTNVSLNLAIEKARISFADPRPDTQDS
jgi:hypothetical protein